MVKLINLDRTIQRDSLVEEAMKKKSGLEMETVMKSNDTMSIANLLPKAIQIIDRNSAALISRDLTEIWILREYLPMRLKASFNQFYPSWRKKSELGCITDD